MNLAEIVKNVVKMKLTEDILNERTYRVYHGSTKKFEKFDTSKIGTGQGSAWYGTGFYFTDKKSVASSYGGNIITAEITLDSPLNLTNLHYKDTSIDGSGLIRVLNKVNGFEMIKYKGKTITELNTILDKVEQDYDPKNIDLVNPGLGKDGFMHVIYEDDDFEFTLYNLTEPQYSNTNYLKRRIVSVKLDKKYGIGRLPMTIDELINPAYFTKIAKENGYDGVIVDGEIGMEYVVFDSENISIVK